MSRGAGRSGEGEQEGIGRCDALAPHVSRAPPEQGRLRGSGQWASRRSSRHLAPCRSTGSRTTRGGSKRSSATRTRMRRSSARERRRQALGPTAPRPQGRRAHGAPPRRAAPAATPIRAGRLGRSRNGSADPRALGLAAQRPGRTRKSCRSESTRPCASLSRLRRARMRCASRRHGRRRESSPPRRAGMSSL